MSQIAFPTTKPRALFPILSSFNPQQKLQSLNFGEILPSLNLLKINSNKSLHFHTVYLLGNSEKVKFVTCKI